MIPKIQQNDWHIMNDLIKDRIPAKNLCILNNCRLYLQITTLAEITNHDGKHLISEACYSKQNESPSLGEVSKLKYNWQNQNNLGKSVEAMDKNHPQNIHQTRFKQSFENSTGHMAKYSTHSETIEIQCQANNQETIFDNT